MLCFAIINPHSSLQRGSALKQSDLSIPNMVTWRIQASARKWEDRDGEDRPRVFILRCIKWNYNSNLSYMQSMSVRKEIKCLKCPTAIITIEKEEKKEKEYLQIVTKLFLYVELYLTPPPLQVGLGRKTSPNLELRCQCWWEDKGLVKRSASCCLLLTWDV